MLFNSPSFLFLFLPLTLLAVGTALWIWGRKAGAVVLVAASLIFYGWDDPHLLGILATSILVNFGVSHFLAFGHRRSIQLAVLWLGIVANLGALGYYKYAGFLGDALGFSVRDIALPLGISFFTFQQIAYLVDTYNGKMARVSFLNYVVSVTFFPHLIAGPLIHYKAIMDQVQTRLSVTSSNLLIGLPMFAIGLAKKCAIADSVATISSPLFVQAHAAPLDFLSAWIAALGYTTQLYFDFSGYSDMALGLGFMFGIALPINFLSPYKSLSIIEFWRRWHITLSNFLRDYLYFPLGGGRVGPLRRYCNLMIVMLLGGLWHGAGWTFVMWGGLHGSYLVVNHLWRNQVSPHISARNQARLTPLYAVATFLAIVVAWVLFRAQNVETARNVLVGMFGRTHLVIPGELGLFINVQKLHKIFGATFGGGISFIDLGSAIFWITLGLAIAWLAPNSAQIMNYDGKQMPSDGPRPALRAAATGALLWASAFGVLGAVPSEFLYFKF